MPVIMVQLKATFSFKYTLKYFWIKYNLRDLLKITGSGKEQKWNKTGHKLTTVEAIILSTFMCWTSPIIKSKSKTSMGRMSLETLNILARMKGNCRHCPSAIPFQRLVTMAQFDKKRSNPEKCKKFFLCVCIFFQTKALNFK